MCLQCVRFGAEIPKIDVFLLLCFCPFGTSTQMCIDTFIYDTLYIKYLVQIGHEYRLSLPDSLKFGRQLNDLLIAWKGTCPNKRICDIWHFTEIANKTPVIGEENPPEFPSPSASPLPPTMARQEPPLARWSCSRRDSISSWQRKNDGSTIAC